MKAVLVGAVESTRVALLALAAAPEWNLAAVISLPPSLAHRHSDFVDLTDDAAAAGSRLISVSNINAHGALAEIGSIAPDYIFVIGWSQVCGAQFMAIAKRGLIGFHPAPLPRLRGRAVIPWTILLDEPISASTLFMIDQGVDSGPILAQRYFHVAPDETAATLYATHMAMLADMLPKVLRDIANGTAKPAMQDHRHATYAARRRPEDALIDWSESARSIWRTIRACGQPYPGAWTEHNGKQLVIEAARPVPLAHHRAAMPGQIVKRDAASFVVRCGDDAGIEVFEWSCPADETIKLHTILGQGQVLR